MKIKILTIILMLVYLSQSNLFAQKYDGGDGDGYSSSIYFPAPDPFTATTTGIQQINITWDKIESSDESVMLAYNTSNNFGTPVNNSTYSAGDAISGGGAVLYNGSAESYFHYNLNTSTTYYYKAWSVDSKNNYSTGTTDNATTYDDSYLNRYNGGSSDGYSSYKISIPVLDNIEATVLSYTENDAATVISATLTAADPDDTNLESAAIVISANYQSSEDVLSFTNQNGITGSWNSSNGTMSLTGSSTIANYQTALRSVKYFNTSENPSTAQRTIEFTVNDGDDNSNTVSRNVDVTSVNDPPTGGNEAITIKKNNSKTFAESDFTYNDAEGDGFAGIKVTSIASLIGSLKYNGTEVTVNQSCPDVTLLVYSPVNSEYGTPYTTFNFKVSDGTTVSASEYTMTVNVNHSDDNAEGGNGDGYASSLYFPAPTPLSATTTGIQQIKITWDKIESGDDNVMIAYNTSNSFGTPVNTSTYSAGDPISGGGTVLYNGSASSYFHYNLNTGTTYYYEAWSVDSKNNYSADIADNTNTYANSYLARYKGGIADGSASGSTADNIPLPVELTTFSAKVKGTDVSLNWQTATEVDNYGFEIQRALSVQDTNNLRGQETHSGNSDLEGYTTIGFVPGHGNSNSPEEYSYTDKEPLGGSSFDYRLKQIDVDGNYKYSDIIAVKITPGQFSLNQNYPNPFNPSTVIKYAIPKDGFVTLNIYDMLGRKVQTLVNEKQPAGRYKKTFNASALASGIYFYRISVTGGAGNFVKIKKMILVK